MLKNLFYFFLTYYLFKNAHANNCVANVFGNFLIEASKTDTINSLKFRIETAKGEVQKIIKIDKEIKIQKAAGQTIEVKRLTSEADLIKGQLREMNNEFLTDTAKILEREGVPSLMYTDNNLLILQ